jgi:hypothetical protein
VGGNVLVAFQGVRCNCGERVYPDVAVKDGEKGLYLGPKVALTWAGESSRLTNLSQSTRVLFREVGASLVRSCYCPAQGQKRES